MRTLLLALLLLPTPALAGFTVTGKPKVDFYAVGNPGLLDIDGKSDQLSVSDDGTTVTFKLPMASVRTGIALRDHHMNEKYVEIATFPDVTLAFSRADVPWPTEVGQAASGTVAAEFTAHGVARPTQVKYTVKKSKVGYRIHGEFPFDISQHGIVVPAYLGITVESAMRAEATVDVVEQ
jgi:polyisoprenoid-binding protein YceI